MALPQGKVTFVSVPAYCIYALRDVDFKYFRVEIYHSRYTTNCVIQFVVARICVSFVVVISLCRSCRFVCAFVSYHWNFLALSNQIHVKLSEALILASSKMTYFLCLWLLFRYTNSLSFCRNLRLVSRTAEWNHFWELIGRLRPGPQNQLLVFCMESSKRFYLGSSQNQKLYFPLNRNCCFSICQRHIFPV